MDKLLPTLLLVAGGAAVWYLTRNQRGQATPTQVIVSAPVPNVTNSGSDGMYDFLTALSGNVAGVATSYIENVARWEIDPEDSVKNSSTSLMPD